MRYVFLTLLLSACAVPAGLNLGNYSDPDATPSDFIYCHGYGCTQKIRIGLHEREWKQVEKIFKKSKSAQEERDNIAKAVALMERWTGALANTSQDQAYAPIIKKSNQELDCVDETVNTHKYLTFFEKTGLLKFHMVSNPVFKGFLLDGTYPHNSAAVIEKGSSQAYVIDSYIHANGKEPVIRTLEDWRARSTFESEEP